MQTNTRKPAGYSTPASYYSHTGTKVDRVAAVKARRDLNCRMRRAARRRARATTFSGRAAL